MSSQKCRQVAFETTYSTPIFTYAAFEQQIAHSPIVLRRNLQPRSRSIISKNRKLQYLGNESNFLVMLT